MLVMENPIMINPRLLIATLVIFLVSVQEASAQDAPVSVTAQLKPAKKTNLHTLHLAVEIQPGWHIYDVVGQGASVRPTTVEISLPTGAKKVGQLKRPNSFPDLKKPGHRVYQGAALFSQQIRLGKKFKGGKAKLTLSYQVCNETRCQPPAQLTANIALSGDLWVARKKTAPKQPEGPSLFAAPQMLMVGNQPLNQAARQMYPSPAIYDVDNDGQLELVVGDIFGKLNIYENENGSAKGDPAWSSHQALKSFDGKPIKVSNW